MRSIGEGALRSRLGPYQIVADHLLAVTPAGRHPWVRDVTISNSTLGNRYVQVAAPHLGVHALGGGIGQGIAMAIGAAAASPEARTIALLGDGGAQLGIAELITAVDESLPITFVLNRCVASRPATDSRFWSSSSNTHPLERTSD